MHDRGEGGPQSESNLVFLEAPPGVGEDDGSTVIRQPSSPQRHVPSGHARKDNALPLTAVKDLLGPAGVLSGALPLRDLKREGL
eukprot:737748-Lingulodinium_polyedra.AAC.1